MTRPLVDCARSRGVRQEGQPAAAACSASRRRPADFTVTRIDDDVYAQFTVPTVNVDGVGPADVARVELYAVTADRAPRDRRSRTTLRQLSTLVGSEQVRRPLPPLAAGRRKACRRCPLPPPGPGVDQGAVDRHARAADAGGAHAASTLPEPRAAGSRTQAEVDPRSCRARSWRRRTAAGPQRYYFAVAVQPARPLRPADRTWCRCRSGRPARRRQPRKSPSTKQR